MSYYSNPALTSDVERLLESMGELPEPMVSPALVVVSGLPGTGKTYFSRRLAERFPFTIVESDAMRKVLFPTPSYSHHESSHLFEAIHCLIENLLERGTPVILDATNLQERNRERIYHIADTRGARLIIVNTKSPPEFVRQRLEERNNESGERSDADWQVYQRMRPSVERIGRNFFSLDTSRDITPVIEKVVRQVKRR